MKKSLLLPTLALALVIFVSPAFAQTATISGDGSTRLVLKPTSTTNYGSNLRWQNNSGTSLFTSGTDFNGNTGHNWFLYDNVNTATNISIDNTGTSFLAFGASGSGGFQYFASTDELDIFINSTIRLRLTENAFKVSTHPYYQRRTSGTAKPTLGSNCNGTGTATWANNDSSDVRGAVTLGTNSSACTLTFAVPWDLSVSVGFPICVANTSTANRNVSVTGLTDHEVTFTPSSSGSTTIYYHCDGIVPPP